jgi:hypothetical protein
MSENTFSPYGENPGLVKTIAVLTLVNGIFNILWGLGITAGIVLGTFFIGLICAPITILPAILGVFEMIYALKLLSNPPQPVQPSTAIAIMEILCVVTGNVFSMIVGILVLIFYNDPQVKDFFARLNGMPVPVPPRAPVPPVSPAAPEPAQPVEAEALPEAAPEAEAPVAPEPKKPRKRKVADESLGTAPEDNTDSPA